MRTRSYDEITEVGKWFLINRTYDATPEVFYFTTGEMSIMIIYRLMVQAEVMTMHVICGLTQPRVAELLGLSTATVERDLRFARVRLKSQMENTHVDES